MKKECAVVQDLLVLYEDDVLKEESRRMVEEHIQGCEECMQVYENAGKELPAMEAVSGSSREEQETAANQVMKRLMKMSSQRIVGGLLLIVLIILIIITVGGNIYDNVTETNWGLSALCLGIPENRDGKRHWLLPGDFRRSRPVSRPDRRPV